METTIPETQKTSKTKMLRKLVQGQELTTKLLNLVRSPSKKTDFHVLAPEILPEILNSFTESLSAISCESSVQDQETFSDEQRSEGSSESRKRPTAKDKRGCYKRRKDAQTWTTVTSTLEDGHAWRKYGQKEILNSKFPRAYFRCTRKHDQGCKAIKQIQKLEDNPNLYHTTYIDVHTCKDVLKAPQIITADSNPWDTCIVFSSESSDQSKNFIPRGEELDFSSCTSTLPVKQDFSSKDKTALMTDKNNTSSMDSMFWPADLDTALMSPNTGSFYSCTDTGSQLLDLDDFVGSQDFNSEFFPFGR